jgi:hypothetical protein
MDIGAIGQSVNFPKEAVRGSAGVGVNPTQVTDGFSKTKVEDANLIPRVAWSSSDGVNGIDILKAAVGVTCGIIGGVLGAALGVAYDCTIVFPLAVGVTNGDYYGDLGKCVLKEFLAPFRWGVSGAKKGYRIGTEAFDE